MAFERPGTMRYRTKDGTGSAEGGAVLVCHVGCERSLDPIDLVLTVYSASGTDGPMVMTVVQLVRRFEPN